MSEEDRKVSLSSNFHHLRQEKTHPFSKEILQYSLESGINFALSLTHQGTE